MPRVLLSAAMPIMLLTQAVIRLPVKAARMSQRPGEWKEEECGGMT
jgi:hypothetical protein